MKKAIDNACRDLQLELNGIGETGAWVGVIEDGHEVDFWKTSWGWIRAVEEKDGTYSALTMPQYRRRTGLGGAVARKVEALGNMGVRTHDTAAAAIRHSFRNRLIELELRAEMKAADEAEDRAAAADSDHPKWQMA